VTHWNPEIWVGGHTGVLEYGHWKPGTGGEHEGIPGKLGSTLKCCRKDESLEFWNKASHLLITFFKRREHSFSELLWKYVRFERQQKKMNRSPV
jgi:hypothetical protein